MPWPTYMDGASCTATSARRTFVAMTPAAPSSSTSALPSATRQPWFPGSKESRAPSGSSRPRPCSAREARPAICLPWVRRSTMPGRERRPSGSASRRSGGPGKGHRRRRPLFIPGCRRLGTISCFACWPPRWRIARAARARHCRTSGACCRTARLTWRRISLPRFRPAIRSRACWWDDRRKRQPFAVTSNVLRRARPLSASCAWPDLRGRGGTR